MVESIKELRKICRKPKDRQKVASLYEKSLRSITIYFTKFFLELNITANHVTLLMLLSGLISFFFLVSHDLLLMFIGAIILHFAFLLDLVDGEVARYNKQYNLVGVHIDQIYHNVIPKFMYFGLALSVFLETNKLTAIIFGFLCVIFSTSIVFSTLAWELVRIRLLEKKKIKNIN